MRIVLLIFFAAVCLLRCKNVESPVAAIPMADVKDKPKPAPEVSLAGNVFDKEGHLPIWGATILVTGANAAGDSITLKAVTDTAGYFYFGSDRIKIGFDYSIDVSAKSYKGLTDKCSTVGVTSSRGYMREYFLVKEEE